MEPDHGMGALEWLSGLVVWALIFVPVAKIFHRAGFHWAWAILTAIPLFGIIISWLVLAEREWKWRGQG